MSSQDEMQSIENISEQDSVFIYIKNILNSDANLCNYSRYLDFGKIKNITYDGYRWKTIPCVLNDQNKINNTQLIRFVQRLDTKFLTDLEKLRVSEDNFSCKDLDIIFNNVSGRKHEYYSNISEMERNITNIMVNVDCQYKIAGSSLTALDFVGKNSSYTTSECNGYCNLLFNNVTKLIFVGDKCYLLAIVDRHHRVYVSTKILASIYKKDETEDKNVFKTIILKFFNLISTCCIYIMNHNMTQYFTDMLLSPIVANIYDNNKFTMDQKISLNSLKNFTFSDEKQTDDFIRENIMNVIKRCIETYINKNYYIDNIQFGEIIRSVREQCTKANKHLINKAYVDGVRLNNVFSGRGWGIVSDVKSEMMRYKYRRFSLNDEHVYIYKDMDFIPCVAYLYADQLGDGVVDRHNPLRKIKPELLNEYHNDTGMYIGRIYIDITNGTMVCDGIHPNVSSGAVCMGDLKGRVVFNGCTTDQIDELLEKCEKLLTCINYTSSYTSDGRGWFTRDTTSLSYKGMDENSSVTQQSNDEVVDLQVVTSDDLEEVDETQQDNVSNGTSDVTSDFDEITDDDIIEEES